MDKINSLIKKAMIEKDNISKDILRLLKSEITKESDKAKDLGKEFGNLDRDNVIKKMIKNNQMTLRLLLEDESANDKTVKVDGLVKEINILKTLLPQSLSLDEFKSFVTNGNIDISSCKNEGQATGLLIKETKKANIGVDIGIIKEYIKERKLFV